MKGSQTDGFCVYAHVFPNGKRYIGITGKKPETRWRRGTGYQSNRLMTNAIEKYGWENIKHEILARGLGRDEAAQMEQLLIAEYKSNEYENGYNLSDGGECSASGAKWSEESKAKNSKAHKGKKNSEEHNRNISEALKRRQKKTGRESAHHGILFQIDEKTGDVLAEYYGFPEMCRITGYALTPVKEAAAGKRKRAYGYLWEYRRGGQNVAV